jgi:hypothetical protein
MFSALVGFAIDSTVASHWLFYWIVFVWLSYLHFQQDFKYQRLLLAISSSNTPRGSVEKCIIKDVLWFLDLPFQRRFVVSVCTIPFYQSA